MIAIPKSTRWVAVTVVLGGFMLIVAIVAMFKLLFFSRSPQTASSPQVFVSQRPSPTSLDITNQINPTANWRTYVRSQAPQFLLKYPPHWSIRTSETTLVIESPNLSPKSEEPTSGALYYVEILDMYPIPANTTNELDKLTQSTDTLEVINKKPTYLLGNPAISYTARDMTQAQINGLNVALETGFLRILLINYGHDSNDPRLLDQILSTLRFDR